MAGAEEVASDGDGERIQEDRHGHRAGAAIRLAIEERRVQHARPGLVGQGKERPADVIDVEPVMEVRERQIQPGEDGHGGHDQHRDARRGWQRGAALTVVATFGCLGFQVATSFRSLAGLNPAMLRRAIGHRSAERRTGTRGWWVLSHYPIPLVAWAPASRRRCRIRGAQLADGSFAGTETLTRADLFAMQRCPTDQWLRMTEDLPSVSPR